MNIKWSTVQESPLIASGVIYQKWPLVGYNLLVTQKDSLFVLDIKDKDDKDLYSETGGSFEECISFAKKFVSETQKEHLSELENVEDLSLKLKESFEKSPLYKSLNIQQSTVESQFVHYVIESNDKFVTEILSINWAYDPFKAQVSIKKSRIHELFRLLYSSFRTSQNSRTNRLWSFLLLAY